MSVQPRSQSVSRAQPQGVVPKPAAAQPRDSDVNLIVAATNREIRTGFSQQYIRQPRPSPPQPYSALTFRNKWPQSQQRRARANLGTLRTFDSLVRFPTNFNLSDDYAGFLIAPLSRTRRRGTAWKFVAVKRVALLRGGGCTWERSCNHGYRERKGRVS